MQRLEIIPRTGPGTPCRIYPITLAGERDAGVDGLRAETARRHGVGLALYTFRPIVGPVFGRSPRMHIVRSGGPAGGGWTAA